MWVGGLSESRWAHEEPRRDSRPETWTRLRQSAFIASREIIHCDQSGDCTQTQQLCWIRTNPMLLCCFSTHLPPLSFCVTGGRMFLWSVFVMLRCAAALRWLLPQQKPCMCHTHIPLSAAHLDLTPNTPLLNPQRTSQLSTTNISSKNCSGILSIWLHWIYQMRNLNWNELNNNTIVFCSATLKINRIESNFATLLLNWLNQHSTELSWIDTIVFGRDAYSWIVS